MGAITDQERYNAPGRYWTHARKQVTEDLMAGLQNDYRDDDGRPFAAKSGGFLRYLNPIAMMAVPPALAVKVDQIRQLAGCAADGQAVRRNHRNAELSRTSGEQHGSYVGCTF